MAGSDKKKVSIDDLRKTCISVDATSATCGLRVRVKQLDVQIVSHNRSII